jgi:hypothetical protein
MSDYINYVEDFPNRCKSILELARPAVNEKGYEVTLLLMVASTALTVPYERLKPEGDTIQPIQDRTRFQCAAKQLKDLLDQRFLSSQLWNTGSVSSWKGDNLASVNGMPEEWKELNDPIALTAEASVCCVLKAIRNALSHGNLYTKNDTRDQITRIVFVTGLAKRKTGKIISPYRFVEVSPDDFSLFLNKWFEFLTKLELPREFAIEILDEVE